MEDGDVGDVVVGFVDIDDYWCLVISVGGCVGVVLFVSDFFFDICGVEVVLCGSGYVILLVVFVLDRVGDFDSVVGGSDVGDVYVFGIGVVSLVKNSLNVYFVLDGDVVSVFFVEFVGGFVGFVKFVIIVIL